jgi:hypothetical protein
LLVRGLESVLRGLGLSLAHVHLLERRGHQRSASVPIATSASQPNSHGDAAATDTPWIIAVNDEALGLGCAGDAAFVPADSARLVASALREDEHCAFNGSRRSFAWKTARRRMGSACRARGSLGVMPGVS